MGRLTIVGLMIDIGSAAQDHLPEVVAILNQVAATSDASFDTEPTTVADRREWFAVFGPTGPYRLLVARDCGRRILGYASSRPYRDHEAFRETVETGISLHADSRGQGVGTQLYQALFEILDAEPVHVAVAGIALPNEASVSLHRKFGFTDVGVFHEYAVKNGRYISSLWLQRQC